MRAALDGCRIFFNSCWKHSGWYLIHVIGVFLGTRSVQHDVLLAIRRKHCIGDALVSRFACS